MRVRVRIRINGRFRVRARVRAEARVRVVTAHRAWGACMHNWNISTGLAKS